MLKLKSSIICLQEVRREDAVSLQQVLGNGFSMEYKSVWIIIIISPQILLRHGSGEQFGFFLPNI